MFELESCASQLDFPFLSLVLELQSHQSYHVLSPMQSCGTRLLGRQLQNQHRNVPGTVDIQNNYFKKELLLAHALCI